MSFTENLLIRGQERTNWVRLRTLVTLRWFAIVGQSIAIFVAVRVYNIEIAVGQAALVVIAAVIASNVGPRSAPSNDANDARFT